MQYRAEIDGLRAVAVLPVIAYHAGIPGLPGGFVGVDVFFVISGFLITSIILEDIRAERFSLVAFYERRCRRILPALFVVLGTTAVLASFLLIPEPFEGFAESLLSASLFVSAFYFRGEPGYFDLSSDFAPLLHTWSLSVEEIFYLVFPLLMIACFRPGFTKGRWVLLAICFLSFLGATLALARNPESRSAFYFPHARAWELLLGSMAVLFPAIGVRFSRLSGGLSFVGLAMILAAVLFYSGETPFPGPAALLPCLGCWLVIVFGGEKRTAVQALLSHPVPVWIGRASFSLYLWHWPLLVMMRTVEGGPLTPSGTAGVLGLSACLSVLTLFLVERPFRGAQGILSRRQIFAFAALGTLALCAFGAFGKITGGWPERYTGTERAVVNAGRDIDPRRYECLQSLERAQGCLYGDPERPPIIGLWGDSHAAMYATGLGEVARRHDSAALVFTMSSCAPADRYAGPDHPWRDSCEDMQALALQTFIKSETISTVILSARWHGHGLHTSNPDLDTAIRSAIDQLLAAGKRVVVVYPVPEFRKDVPQFLTNMMLTGDLPNELAIARDRFNSEARAEKAYLDSLPPDLTRLYPAEKMCDAVKCYFLRDNLIYSHDAHHLSVTGARVVAEIFEPLFEAPGN